jgi:acyl transferase domain-containing protein
LTWDGKLFAIYPAFRNSILEMDTIYQDCTGKSLVTSYEFFSERTDSIPGPKLPSDLTVVLPALLMFQIATFDFLQSIGLKPTIVVGHSAGETGLAYVAEGNKRLAIELAIRRARFMTKAQQIGGGMASVSCDPAVAQSIVEGVLADQQVVDHDALTIACYNAADAVTICGISHLVDAFCVAAKSRGLSAQRLRIPIPSHSPLLDRYRAEWFESIGDLFRDSIWAPAAPIYSTVTNSPQVGPYDAQYYWRNMLEPVRFQQTIEAIIREHPSAVYVEVSPHPVLSTYISSTVSGHGHVVSLFRRPSREGIPAEERSFANALAKLAVLGINLDYNRVNGCLAGIRDPALPRFPFIKKAIPFHANHPSFDRRFSVPRGTLNDIRLRVNEKTHPLLAQHVIHGVPIMPAAGFIEMVRRYLRPIVTEMLRCYLGSRIWCLCAP